MNKIYKVIWNKTRGMYMVVSELAKGQSKDGRRAVGRKKMAQTAAALAVFFSIVSMGGTSFAADPVTIGTATVKDTSGNEQKVLTVTQGDASTIGDTLSQVSTNETDIATNKANIETLQTNTQKISYATNYAKGITTIDSSLNVTDHLVVGSSIVAGTNVRASGFVTTPVQVTNEYGTTTSINQLTISGSTIQGGTTTKTVEVNSQNNVSLTAGTRQTNSATVSGGNVINQASYTILNNAGTGIQNNVSGDNGYISNSAAQIKSVASKTITEQITGTDSEGNQAVVNEVKSDANGTTFTNSGSSTTIKGNAISTGSIDATGNITAASVDVTDKLTAGSASVTNSISVGHNANVGGAVNAGSLNSRGNLSVDGNVLVKGTLTSQSTINGNEIVSQTNITAKNKVVGMQGVVDNTLTSGNYVTAGNTVGENIVALDTQVKANADAIEEEARKRKYSVTNLENADKQLQTNIDNEAAAREAKDNELNERITNEANAIHDEIKAGDTALDNRITAVKESLQQEAADTYVSKDDASVQDGAVVKANNKVGQNVQALDTALAKETAARIGADKAQDQVIAQVNQNMADGFNTINTNMANGFAALNAADAAEKEARIGADKKLAEAVNSGLSLSEDNVLQKNTTTVADDGMVTTFKTDANAMILNKGNKNQITMDEKGVKVGTNSSVMDADGVYTGGDTFDAAKAAMKSDGQIKGANGKFTVDASGNTTVTSLDAGTGTIQTKGDLYAKDATFSGDITAKDATLSGDLSAKDGTFSGDLSAKDGTFSGDVSAKDVTATGTLQGAEVTDGTATMKNGNITGVKDLSAETITTSGDATIGGDLTVKGKLNVDEIDLTKNGIVGDNNVTASTKVAAGEITGYKKATSTKDGSEKEAAFDYDENGTSTWAKATDADGNWNKSTMAVEGSGVTSKVIDSEKNSNLATQSQSTLTDADKNTNTATQSAAESSSVLSDKDGNNTSSFRQRIDQILQEIKSANGSTSVEQTDVNITNTAANGTITNDAKALVNKASDSITSQIGDGSAVKSVMDANGIANTATGGTISNSAANISNTTTGNMTNTVGGNLIDTIMGTSTTTVTGKVTEDYKSDLSTKVGGDETHAVTGNQTTTVSGNRTVNVKGTETENFNAMETNVKTDQKTSVGGNQTNIVGGDQQNTVSGSKTETVKGSVKEKYGSQATTVDGDQSTNIGGNQTTVVAKDQTNTVSGNKTETVKGAVNETYGSQTTKVNGDQSTTVTGKQTNSITGDQVNTIGGNQTTTVTGDSSLTAENITNEAKNKITNKALDVETDASSSIVSKVFNEYGSNTSTQLSYQTTEEMSQADGKKASYLRGAAEEKSQLTDGDKKTTIDTIAGQTNTNITDGTNTSNSLQKADQVASSVTDGTNTTVVNQDARSIASSITDGTKANSTNSTVDKSEQLIKTSDSQYNASVKTATASAERLVSGNIIDILKDAETGYVNTTVSSGTGDDATSTSVKQGTADITNTAKQGTITNEAKNLVNKAEEKLSNSAAEIENTATTSIKDVVGKSTVTTTDTGTTFENSDHAAAIGEGSITQTTISGNTLETGKATADYVDVNKDLNVKGNTKLDGTLEVAGKSTFKNDVTMEKDLDVKGTTTTDKLVVNNGATVTGGTTTDTLHVTSTSTFDGLATFKDAVSMEKDLSVGGNATVAGDVTASSYKVGDKTYIDQSGLNANNQKVTNVADGDVSEGSTDAVNGGQLHATNQRVSTVENRMDGVENRVDRVENRVDNLDNRIDKVGASAAAMANLHPMDFDEDSKVSVAAAVGSYRSETAGALGVFYRPTDRVMMNVSTSFGNGENMVGGVSFKLGKSSKRLQQAEATNAALSKQVANLQNRLDALLGVLNPNLSKAFPDVPANHWAYEAVSKLAGNDIVQGYEDGKYHGERTMSRYEMAEIIYNALSKGAKAEAKLVEEFRPELQAMAAQRKA
ncbi:ESPR-type extended signal peptide-containing protein [Acidaminococcus timonensis]|uniref:ESPR-type extended signal peptide-containing protein n=1 Tax=Acidaminococcus timonensis TaxID=1871002 RepID=UPI0029436E9C|nr:ESPR-type extended signal peptide-containing protein [Acidaminococcus timonensis]